MLLVVWNTHHGDLELNDGLISKTLKSLVSNTKKNKLIGSNEDTILPKAQ